jgi:uncharacterized protein
MIYTPRIVDAELQKRLKSSGAVVIEGPKACGKTETARQVAASSVLLDIDAAARQALEVDPSLVLEGATPRLIDEWQIEPNIWNHVRRVVDDRDQTGQFVLTGSSVPRDDEIRHTGAGRFSFLRMRPMSLFEAGHSNGDVSLADLMHGGSARCIDPGLDVSDIADRISVGGWPAQVRLTGDEGAQAARDYLEQIRRVDVGRVAKEFRDPNKVGQLLRSLARNVATEVSLTVLATDAGGADGPLARNTVASYLEVLERLMIVEDQPAWSPHLRSRATLRSAAKRHFVDPSLAAAALAATPKRIIKDLNFLGLLFESLVIRDLRVLSEPLGGNVLHYRDSYGLEVDAILQLADGRWAAIEIKLGVGRVDEAATSLNKFAQLVDTTKSGEPAFLAVITSSGLGYRRKDGVNVVPIGSLGP